MNTSVCLHNVYVTQFSFISPQKFYRMIMRNAIYRYMFILSNNLCFKIIVLLKVTNADKVVSKKEWITMYFN